MEVTRRKVNRASSTDELRALPKLSRELSSNFLIVKCCASIVFFALLAVFILLWILPAPIDPVSFIYSKKVNAHFSGPLIVNDGLKKSRRLYENKITGPEALIQDHKGNIYTGLNDGRIIQFGEELSVFQTVTWTGPSPSANCGSPDTEMSCGRPLGMQFHPSLVNHMYIADSTGLLRFNVETKELSVLLPAGTNLGGRKVTFLNDLVVLSNNTVIISESSCKYTRADNRYEVLESRANGRLLYFNLIDGSYGVLREEIHFSNGICLSHDGKSLLIVETTRARILKYHLSGDRAGETEIFVENLPGLPDNISPSSSGGYWLGIAAVRTSILDYMAEMVTLRKIISKWLLLMTLLEMIIPKHGLIVEIDADGAIVQSFHDEGGDVTYATSHVLDLGEKLLIGSYFAPFLLELKL